MMTDPSDDRALVTRLLSGDRDAARQFLQRMDDPIRTACRALAADERCFRDFHETTLAAIRQDCFRLLRGYSGQCPLTTFVVLTTRDIVHRRLLQLVCEDRTRGWRAFETCFQSAIRKQIAHRTRAADRREDAYQEVCMALVEGDFRRLRSYRGGGTFSAFVFRTVENLLVDLERAEQGRRRPPAAIDGLRPLDRLVFRALYWAQIPADPARLRSGLPSRAVRGVTDLELEQSVRRVRAATPPGYLPCGTVTIGLSQIDAKGLDAEALRQRRTAEDDLIARENATVSAEAVAALDAAIADLGPEQQLCLRLALQGQKPQQIARQVGRTVDAVYRILRKARARLRRRLQPPPCATGQVATVRRGERRATQPRCRAPRTPTRVTRRHADA